MSSDSLAPVMQRTLAAEVADQLRSAIRSGAMPPGTRLVEREIAERLGVSRIPLREAIERLAEEGLVRKLPHRGAFVYAPSRKEIEEIATLRVVLERFAVERAIAHWKPEHAARLLDVAREMRRAAVERDAQQLAEMDTLFHQTLLEIADHSILLEVAMSMRSRISRFLYEAITALMQDAGFDALVAAHARGHEMLVDTLNSGDVAAAQDTCARHILEAETRILARCKNITQ